MLRSVCTLGVVLFLAACGGGGGSAPLPTVDLTTPRLTGLQPPSFSDAQILPMANAVLARSDSVTVSDLASAQGGGEAFYPTLCSSKTTCVTNLGSGTSVTWDIRDARDIGLDSNLNYSGVGEKHGVSLAQSQGRTTLFSFPADSTAYAGLLDHSMFGVSLDRIVSGTFQGVNLSGIEVAYSVSGGNDTGSRPVGSATWQGIMVGGTGGFDNPQWIQGDANVTWHLDQSTVDVAFTDVHNLATRARITDMRWSGVPVGSDGSFRQETAARDIEGRFYGPGHAEVGGIFAHPNAIGAFGAKKQ